MIANTACSNGVIRYGSDPLGILREVGLLARCGGVNGLCSDCRREIRRTLASEAGAVWWGLKSGTGQPSPKGRQNGHAH